MRRCRPLLGTFVEIECDRDGAIDAGFAVIPRVHRLMSAHEANSELSQVNRYAHLRPIEVSADTIAVLRRALHWSRLSGGAFDVVRAGARATAHGHLPLHPGQAQLDDSADWTTVKLVGRLVNLDRPACVDLGGIAKGHAVDLAVAALKREGASAGLVNAGGDLRAFGPRDWPVAIVEPLRRLPMFQLDVRDSAVATSAGLPGGSGLSFDHLVERRRGWTSVTVAASDARDADCLTKIVWALGHGAAPLLAEAGAEAFAIRTDGGIESIGAAALAA